MATSISDELWSRIDGADFREEKPVEKKFANGGKFTADGQTSSISGQGCDQSSKSESIDR